MIFVSRQTWVVALGVCLASGTSFAATSKSCSSDRNFTWVPGGTAILGSDQAERDFAYRLSAETVAKADGDPPKQEKWLRKQGWFDDEDPKRSVQFDGFCISKYAVTNNEYAKFVRSTGHSAPTISEADYKTQGFLVHSYSEVVPYLWHGTKFPAGSGNKPAVLASYDDAVSFANWQSKTQRKSFRLPTATEWEIAARGTDGRRFPWGNDWREGVCNSLNREKGATRAVGAFPKSVSPFGLYGTVCNVFEYTRLQNASNSRVLLKGCGWDDLPGFCRPAYQHTRPRLSRHILFGFRLVME